MRLLLHSWRSAPPPFVPVSPSGENSSTFALVGREVVGGGSLALVGPGSKRTIDLTSSSGGVRGSAGQPDLGEKEKIFKDTFIEEESKMVPPRREEYL